MNKPHASPLESSSTLENSMALNPFIRRQKTNELSLISQEAEKVAAE